MMRHVWRRVPLIRVVCLPVLCPVNQSCLHVKTSFVKTFWLLYCGSARMVCPLVIFHNRKSIDASPDLLMNWRSSLNSPSGRKGGLEDKQTVK